MIKLSDVIEALEMVNMQGSCYFNKSTNEILWLLENNMEYSTYKEDDEYDDNVISMFNFFDKNDYDIMQEFISNIEDVKIYENLKGCLKGKGAFRRFRDELDSFNLIDSWYKFRDEKYKEIAKEWCISNEIKFEEDC